MNPFLLTEGGGGIVSANQKYLTADVLTSNADIQFFDLSVNLLQAILWQYNDAANLQGLITAKQQWYNDNQQSYWQGWIANVFNLDTANEFGLAVWSIILGLPNFINQSSPGPEVPIFGFDGSGGVNFDNGILAEPNGSSVVLSIETQRTVLQLRYFQLCSSGTVPEINRFLAFLFGPKMAWLIDNHDMTQTYIFNFPVNWELAYTFNNLDILPRPATVGSAWIDATLSAFGFDGAHVEFDQAPLGAWSWQYETFL